MWKLNKSIAKELLPAEPADLAIEAWWGVRFVNFTLEEFKVRSILGDLSFLLARCSFTEKYNAIILFILCVHWFYSNLFALNGGK
jgi:hypothetical protein